MGRIPGGVLWVGGTACRVEVAGADRLRLVLQPPSERPPLGQYYRVGQPPAPSELTSTSRKKRQENYIWGHGAVAAGDGVKVYKQRYK